tara:strand:- start:1328 stop:1537 length:210 start_codon:yes stop_codon:yes gene_type:complete
MSNISDLEIRAQELRSLLDDGDLTQSEFEELIEDLIDESKIQEDLSLEDNKIKLEKAIDTVKIIAGLIS